VSDPICSPPVTRRRSSVLATGVLKPTARKRIDARARLSVSTNRSVTVEGLTTVYRVAIILACLVLALTVFGVGAPSAQSASLKTQNQRLKQQVRALKRNLNDAKRETIKIERQVMAKCTAITGSTCDPYLDGTTTGALAAFGSHVSALQQRLTDRTAERDAALAGLPTAISAVPLDQFWPLVFTPARLRWLCDSYYTAPGFWSVSFDSGC